MKTYRTNYKGRLIINDVREPESKITFRDVVSFTAGFILIVLFVYALTLLQ